jgi:hypothetical protein
MTALQMSYAQAIRYAEDKVTRFTRSDMDLNVGI